MKISKKKYENGGSVDTEPKKQKYPNKKEFAALPDNVAYVARAMESRGIGFDSGRTRQTYNSLTPEQQDKIAEAAWELASRESRQRGSTKTFSGSYKYNTRFMKGGKIKVKKKY